MKRLKILSVAILALLTLIVVLQNTEPVETKILFFTIKPPAALLLFGTGVIGFVLGAAVSLVLGRRRKAAPPEGGSSPPHNAQP